jgi:cytochrome c553
MPSRSSVAAGLLIAVSVIASVFVGAQARRSNPVTAEHMREHFARVYEVEAAVTRGDLEGVRAPAEWLASHDPSKELDKASASQVSTMREAARRAADAKDVRSAAEATGAMLAACGDCHRAAGVSPSPAVSPDTTVGGTVGHMQQHQHAVELMADGLIIPSTTAWSKGVAMLKEAPLRTTQLPKDPKLTREIAASEDRIHVLADQAASATEEQARVAAYSQIISTCAQCHGLHGRVWGPGITPPAKPPVP